MATKYRIRVGDEIIEFEGPDNLSESQIEDLADKQLKTARPGQSFNHAEYGGTYTDEPPAHAADESSAGGSFIRGLPKDAGFGWTDEIAGFGNAAIPGLAALDNASGVAADGQQSGWSDPEGFWHAVKTNAQNIRSQDEADRSLHPLASSAGRVAGLLSTLPRAAGVAAARAPQAIKAFMEAHPLLSGAATGAAGGAVSGAGSSEGNRQQGAALGLTIGAPFGFAVSGAMELAPAVAHYANILLNRLPKRAAISQMIKALHRDGFDVVSPEGREKLRATLQEFTGKPVSLADVGASTRSRAGVALRAPSDIQQQSIDRIVSRQAGQSQRLARDVRANVAPRTDVHSLDADLVAQRAEEAVKLRDKALFETTPDPAEAIDDGVERTVSRQVIPTEDGQVPVPGTRQSRIVDDPQLQQLARLPLAQRALKQALGLAEGERALLATTGKSIDHLPDLNAGSNLDVRTFDYLKRFLDDETNSLYRRGDTATFKAAEAAQVKQLRDAIRERLRQVVPEYGDYLDAYKGSSEMIDALREGQKFDTLDPEEIAAAQAGRSTAGQELYRTGAARNILDKIQSTRDTGNPASRILNSDESRNQLAATGVDPFNAAALNRSVQQERTLNLLPQELSNSATAQRQAAAEDAAEGVNLGIPFNPASKFGWMGMLGRKIINHAGPQRNAAINEELLPRLLETDPKAIDGIIQELEQQGKAAEAARLRRITNIMRTNATASPVVGGLVALPAGDR